MEYFAIFAAAVAASSTKMQIIFILLASLALLYVAMEAAFDVHVDMLDRVFASVLSGKRVGSLSDSRSQRTVGYSYRGRMTLPGALLARRRLGKLFGPEVARADLLLELQEGRLPTGPRLPAGA